MKVLISCTANLGDFLNAMPVLSGLSKKEKISLTIRPEMRKFKGLREFLMYQDLFSEVNFMDEVFLAGTIIEMSSWYHEHKNNPLRPTETCRYENYVRERYYGLNFDVDDDFVFNVPELNIPVKDTYYVGDRWNVGDIDDRRETNILSHLKDFEFINYENDMMVNAYIIKNLKKPFITNFTGVGILSDLLNVPSYVVWKAEDWKPEFRVGNDVSWDNGKNIKQVFEKHFYGDRQAKLIHARDLEKVL